MPAEQPMNLDQIRKNAKLSAALLEHMKKEFNDENFFFYFDKGNPEGLFNKYIKKGSKYEVNLPSKLNKAWHLLAEKGDWKHKEWPKVVKESKTDIHKLVAKDILPRFYKGEAYGNYMKKEKMGDPKKAAKILGIKEVKLLTEAMGAHVTGDKAKTKKLFAELIKKEKMRESVEQIIKNLEKAGLV